MIFSRSGRGRERSTRAAKLGMSQSSLCHTIRELEARLGVRLLTRRQGGGGSKLGPRFEEIDAELALGDLREPAGTIRITAMEYAAEAILLPKLAKLMREYPDIKVEIIIDYGLTDIVAEVTTQAYAAASKWRRT